MIAHIVCGAPDLWLPDVLEGFVIGVDKGALKLLDGGFKMDVAIGDFDSVTAVEKDTIKNHVEEFISLNPEKDMTDCEAAVAYAADSGIKDVYIYGVTGGRIDHFLAVKTLMLKYIKQGVNVVLIDEFNRIQLLKPGGGGIKTSHYRYVSFFAVENAVKALTLKGVKYPLDNFELTVDNPLCVSNEPISKKVSVDFGTGYLLAVQSMDK